NFTTRFAGILIGSPVCGLRPIRAFRLASTSRPKLGTTKTFFASFVASVESWSITSATCFFDSVVFCARLAMMADLVMDFAMCCLRVGYESDRQSPSGRVAAPANRDRIVLAAFLPLNSVAAVEGAARPRERNQSRTARTG